MAQEPCCHLTELRGHKSFTIGLPEYIMMPKGEGWVILTPYNHRLQNCDTIADLLSPGLYCRHSTSYDDWVWNGVRPVSNEPIPIFVPGMPAFDKIAKPWERTLALDA